MTNAEFREYLATRWKARAGTTRPARDSFEFFTDSKAIRWEIAIDFASGKWYWLLYGYNPLSGIGLNVLAAQMEINDVPREWDGNDPFYYVPGVGITRIEATPFQP